MQTDMHFYGTYAIARSAGIPDTDAYIIAYSAQFVDDSAKHNSEVHKDKGLLYGIATAHHEKDSVVNALTYDSEVQRRVWVPFHFMPGGFGDEFEEKLICQKDSHIANEFFKNHIQMALNKKPFGLHLLGIASHVYADTFSHYGFSGISSKYNKVKDDSIKTIDVKNPKVAQYIEGKKAAFFEKYFDPKIVTGWASNAAETLTHGLGHGGVSTYPDRPFLHWQVEYEAKHPEGEESEDRNNRETYLEGCKKLHEHLSTFAKEKYGGRETFNFSEIESSVFEVLEFEGDKNERIEKWTEMINSGRLFDPTDNDTKVFYDHTDWENQKNNFHNLVRSSEGLKTNAYLFHQAATYHRYYTLKDLLPSHGIAVY